MDLNLNIVKLPVKYFNENFQITDLPITGIAISMKLKGNYYMTIPRFNFVLSQIFKNST